MRCQHNVSGEGEAVAEAAGGSGVGKGGRSGKDAGRTPRTFMHTLRSLFTRVGRLGAFLPFCLLPLAAQITESPLTVAPGSFLVEMDAISVTFDRDAGDKYTAVGLASTFLTTGLTERIDVQVGAELYLHQKFDSAGLRERKSGLGDVYFRTKWTFWRDEGNTAAAALLPYVKVPTNSGGVGNDAVEGGLIVPWMRALAGGGHVHAMAQWDLVRNPDDNGYDSGFFVSASLDRPLTKAIGVYAEATASKSSGGEPGEVTIGAGATLAISEHAWWDFSVYRGLTRGAADWNPVIRFNWGF